MRQVTTTSSGRSGRAKANKCKRKRRSPSEVELEVAQDPSAGQESAAHTGHQLPVVQVASTVGMWHVVGLLDELTVHFITEGF